MVNNFVFLSQFCPDCKRGLQKPDREAVHIEHLLEIDPQAQAIVSSGQSDDPIMNNYLDVGYNGIIKKPYRIHEVGWEVKRILTENGK